MMKIPLASMLASSVISSEFPEWSALNLSPSGILSLFVAYAKFVPGAKMDRRVRKYMKIIHSFPDKCLNALTFPASALATLKGLTSSTNRINELKMSYSAIFQHIQTCRRSSNCPAKIEFDISDEEFAWAACQVNSRVFNLKADGVALMPASDLMNHRTVSNVAYGYDIRTHTMSYISSNYIAEGEEIFISYGFNSNAYLLSGYGFVEENNPGHHVLVPIVFPNKESISLGTSLLSNIQSVARLEAQTKHVKYDEIVILNEGFLVSQLAAIRAILLQGNELSSYNVALQFTSKSFISFAHSARVSEYVSTLCQRALNAYKTTAREDKVRPSLSLSLSLSLSSSSSSSYISLPLSFSPSSPLSPSPPLLLSLPLSLFFSRFQSLSHSLLSFSLLPPTYLQQARFNRLSKKKNLSFNEEAELAAMNLRRMERETLAECVRSSKFSAQRLRRRA